MAAIEQAEGTKDRVLRIAADLFATKGYDATGIQELSTAFGKRTNYTARSSLMRIRPPSCDCGRF